MERSAAYALILWITCNLAAGDFEWSLSSSSGAQWWLAQYGNSSFEPVRAVVPGQVHLDLWRSRVIPDPYYGYNDTALRYVAEADWLYSVEFAVPPGACDCINVSLPATMVLEGLDTIAEVVVNGRLVVKADNMYRAYSAPMGRGQLLCDRRNKMSILLRSSVKAARERVEAYERQHAADWPKGVPPRSLPPAWKGFDKVQMIRKEPCSFGWDWGPGIATSGIWKDISVVTHERENRGPVIIEGITWETSSTNGDELDESSYEPWMAYLYMSFSLPADTTIHRVNVELLLSDRSGATFYDGFWEKLRISDLLPGKSGINLLVTSGVKPWWPNGYGEQQRYTLAVCAWAADSERACVPKRFTVGFRSVELVMEDDDSGRSFYFKVNGEPIYARGANWIPSDAFESRVDEPRLRRHFEQYRRAHFNMLRVWGGGVYASDLIYELADEYGFLIWEEAMFAGAAYPTLLPDFLPSVQEEIRQNLIRIGHHPSLAILGGNNEVEAFYGWSGISQYKSYIDSYASLFFDTVVATSKKLIWRPVVPSSPSNGNETRNDPIAVNPNDEHAGDMHFYDYFHPNIFDLRTLPKPRFLSEFGFQSWSSLGELKAVADDGMLQDTLFSDDFRFLAGFSLSNCGLYNRRLINATDSMVLRYLHSETLCCIETWPSHRQHLVSGNAYLKAYVEFMFGTENGESAGPIDMRAAEAYLSQIVQGMWLKLAVEHCRRLRPYNMGLLYWQANDIWPTVSWSTIEYSGRPKVAMTMAQSFYDLNEPTMFLNYSDSPPRFCGQAFAESCEVRVFSLLKQREVSPTLVLSPWELRCTRLDGVCGDGECVAFSSHRNYLILGSMAKFPASSISEFARATIRIQGGFISSEIVAPFVELECETVCEENHLLLLPSQPVWVGEGAEVIGSLWSALDSYRGGNGQDFIVSS